MQISLQPIFYLEERFQSFHEKPLSDFDIFNFKRRPNDLTRYENINIKSLEIYYFNQHYLSKEEKEKIVNQWPEFRSKINFIAKKKKHLNWSVSVILLGNSTELKNILLLPQIVMNISVSTGIRDRGFSKLSIEKTSFCTRMNSQTLSDVKCIVLVLFPWKSLVQRLFQVDGWKQGLEEDI